MATGDDHFKDSVQPDTPTETTTEDNKANKSPGIPENATLKIGLPTPIQAKPEQIKEMNRALGMAYSLSLGTEADRIVTAMVCAGLGESQFRAIRNQGNPPSRYWGVFQGSMDVWEINDTEGMARSFCLGGKGFQPSPTGTKQGGARYWAESNKDWGPGLIAVSVEGSRANFTSDAKAENHYGQYEDQAKQIIELFGGGFTGGNVYVRQQYNFQIGTESEPHEDYWSGMNRLADQVRWRLFLDGTHVYFDSDMTLIRQKPAAVINRQDPAVLKWNATWDARKIATQMEIQMICDPFQYRAGEVFLLEGFGPLSKASNAGAVAGRTPLPGRWLIVEIERSSGNIFSTFTLAQPEKPKREPATSTTTVSTEDATAGSKLDLVDPSMSPKEIIDRIVLPIGSAGGLLAYFGDGKLTPDNVVGANAKHTHLGSGSDHAGPPAQKWAVDMSTGSQAPDAAKDGVARALITAFGLPDLGDWSATSGEHSENLVYANHKGFRFQLIYRMFTQQAGNHYNHVHFGVKKL